MIIFYNKKTGCVIGTVDGRVHDDHTLKHAFIKPSGVKKSDIGKYVVPFEPNIVEEEVPIKELRVVDKKTGRVAEVVIGKETKKVTKGLKPSGCIKHLITAFENGKDNIYRYKVQLDEKGKLVGLTTN